MTRPSILVVRGDFGGGPRACQEPSSPHARGIGSAAGALLRGPLRQAAPERDDQQDARSVPRARRHSGTARRVGNRARGDFGRADEMTARPWFGVSSAAMTPRPPSQDITRITLAVLFIGLMIFASLWVLWPFVAATVWATMIVVATRSEEPTSD